jgi:hypothetical protein
MSLRAFAGPPPVDLPGAVQPGHDRPIPQPQPPPDFDFSVEAPHRSPVPRAVDEIRFKLADIRVVGATTLSPDSFRPLYASLIGKDVSLANIYDVADAIENAYRAAGYLLVRAYVPPQHVKDGIFTIRVVEGFIEGTSVQGGDAATQGQIKAYLAPLVREHPLRLKSIERALLLSNDIPGVSATGVLRPSPSCGRVRSHRHRHGPSADRRAFIDQSRFAFLRHLDRDRHGCLCRPFRRRRTRCDRHDDTRQPAATGFRPAALSH